MADEKTETVEEKAGGKLSFLQNRTVLLGVIVAVQVVLAVGLTQFVILPRVGAQSAATAEQAAEETEEALGAPGQIVGLQEIIVTLDSDARKSRYLRINVNLEVVDQVTADLVAARLPQLRDIVIMALSTKSVTDLDSAEGKRTLRDEIFRDVAARLPEGTLMNVYFSDLVVQ